METSNSLPLTVVPTYTATQVRDAEKPLLDAGEPLMAIAAGALGEIAKEELKNLPPHSPRVLVLTGSGNNGGDALFACAPLARSGAEVDVLTVSDRWHQEGMRAALEAGARRVAPDVAGRIEYDLILDGILGIGTATDPSLRGVAREAVERLLPRVTSGKTRVISVDIPSGLHPDTGAADEAVLPATITVTFGAVKQGLICARGPQLAGRIVLVSIGIERVLAAQKSTGEATVIKYCEQKNLS